jgi:hypothetical protein
MSTNKMHAVALAMEATRLLKNAGFNADGRTTEERRGIRSPKTISMPCGGQQGWRKKR